MPLKEITTQTHSQHPIDAHPLCWNEDAVIIGVVDITPDDVEVNCPVCKEMLNAD